VVPSVELSAQTFARLQSHAVPLVDNIETVIRRLIDFYESRDSAPVPDVDVSAGGKNGLLNTAVRTAKSRAKTAADLKQLVIIPYLNGQKTDEGYRYLPELGLSVQGQDANGAWKAACHIAQKLGLPLTARFVWREKNGAAFPGITGQFSVQGR